MDTTRLREAYVGLLDAAAQVAQRSVDPVSPPDGGWDADRIRRQGEALCVLDTARHNCSPCCPPALSNGLLSRAQRGPGSVEPGSLRARFASDQTVPSLRAFKPAASAAR